MVKMGSASVVRELQRTGRDSGGRGNHTLQGRNLEGGGNEPPEAGWGRADQAPGRQEAARGKRMGRGRRAPGPGHTEDA